MFVSSVFVVTWFV